MSFQRHDITPDSPTNTFATLNPLVANPSSTGTLKDGNLKINHVTNGEYFGYSTIKIDSSKIFYVEALLLTDGLWGITKDFLSISGSSDTTSIFIGLNEGGIIYENGGSSAADSNRALGYGDVLGLLIDGSALSNNLKWYRNNILKYQHTYDLTSNNFQILVGKYSNSVYLNFGQDPTFGGNKNTPATVNSVTGPFAPSGTAAGTAGLFYYPPPTDALALCTANLPDPDIDPNKDDLPEDYMKAVAYSGSIGNDQLVDCGFPADLIWIKGRTASYNTAHMVYDTIRGRTSVLQTQNTDDEFDYGNLAPTISTASTPINGFKTPPSANNNINASANTYVAWCWKAGGAPSGSTSTTGSAKRINTSGTQDDTSCSALASAASATITPTLMSINQKAGFSIVKYVGDQGTGSTIPHGLSQAPQMIIVKTLNGTTTYGWRVYTEMTGNTKYLNLNTPDQATAYTDWNNTSPTLSVFTVNSSTVQTNNESGTDYIAYCWHSVAGYSAFGSYTGNGSTDGPFVYTGFKPAWVMIKSSSYTTTTYTSWAIYDNARETYNPNNNVLYANKSINEGYRGDASTTATDIDVDFLSNGFKVRSDKAEINQNTETYIYAAFAQTPFKYATAR